MKWNENWYIQVDRKEKSTTLKKKMGKSGNALEDMV